MKKQQQTEEGTFIYSQESKNFQLKPKDFQLIFSNIYFLVENALDKTRGTRASFINEKYLNQVMNSNKGKPKISKETLFNLYHTRKLSTRKIARIVHCGKTYIETLMKKYGIKARTKSETSKMIPHRFKYKIYKRTLEKLYLREKLSMGQIAEIYKTRSPTIYNIIKRVGIPTRSFEEGNKMSIPRRSIKIAKSNIIYPKRPFSGNQIEKAYLFGFTAGDLYIKKRKYGATIRMETCTSKKEQVELVRNLFKKYTHVTISNSQEKYQISCNLDLSFSFLLDYKKDIIPDWINDNKCLFSFLGGYIDAEGHFGVSKGIGRFSLSTYDKRIINSIYKRTKKLGINFTKPRISFMAGYTDKRGIKNKKDLWVIRTNRIRELYKFILIIKPFIKHKKRYKDLLAVEINLFERNRRINLNEEKKEILHNYSNLLCK